MPTFTGTDPAQFIANFFESFTADLVDTDEDAARIVDRFHTPDVVQIADGHRIDRDTLIAHARPVRKTRPRCRLDVHEAFGRNDRIAARYTMHIRQRGTDLAIEVCFFGQFTADGRMRSAHLLTRTGNG